MRAILTLVLISALLLSACESEGDRVYAGALKCAESLSMGGDCPPQQVTKQEHPKASGDGQAVAPSPRGAVEARVYIDASESMKGYAAAADSSFVRVIEALGYTMPGCRLYKYGFAGGQRHDASAGQAAFAREIRFSQDLRKPSFYDLDFNEDDVLIKHLAGEDAPALSVLLTDGVYSARNTELQSEVVKAVEEWMNKGRFFGILIFAGPFDGRLYSENRRDWTEPVKVSARPFYAFVFSPDEKEFHELRDQLAVEVKIAGSLAFPREAVSCTVAPQDKNGLEKKDIPPRHPFHLHMYNESVYGGGEQAQMSLDLRCTPAPDYPVAAFKPEPSLEAYTWQQDTFRKNERLPQFTYQLAEQPAASATAMPSPEAGGGTAPLPTPPAATRKQSNLTLTLGRDAIAGYSLYHLTFDLSGRALRPDIRELSTQDDAVIGEAGKTYRFYEFISSLTAMHLQNGKAMAAPPPVFIAVANR
ncbi:MAG TPA: hypothetical protein VIQ24_18965 [Pyrinomonadaceae bacterium]